MSQTRRDELWEDAFAELEQLASGLRPKVPSAPVKSAGDDVSLDRSWHFFAYSYSRAFDSLWDAAYSRPSEVLNYPLLFICWHSIELWLKTALSSVLQADPVANHDLPDLWSRLMDAWADHTRSHPDCMDGLDGAFAGSVQHLIRALGDHDSKGDRFRYPVTKRFESYASTVADLEELYRAHSRITSFCDAVDTQMKVERDEADDDWTHA